MEVAACVMGHIMDPLEEVDLRVMRAIFPEAPTGGIETTEGKVDLLVGQDNFRIIPSRASEGRGRGLVQEPFRNRMDRFGKATGARKPEIC
jgi:hypothetical protein